jgi:hypothetical protein
VKNNDPTKASLTARSTRPEPPVGVKAKRMFEKDTKGSVTKPKAKLLQRQKG